MNKLLAGVVLGTTLFTSSPQHSYGQTGTQNQIFEVLSEDSLRSQDASSKTLFDTMETKEVITQQLSRITTDVIFSFCEEELEVSFNKQEKEEISQVLQTYFLEHPFCGFEGKVFKIYLTKSYADHMVEELLPYFFSKLVWYYKLGARIFIGNNDKIWEKIQKDLNEKNLEKAKDTFIGDFGVAFNKLDIAVGNHFTEKRENITIGEYFSYIMDVFPNPAFKRYISTLSDEQLALPLCNLVSLP